MSEEQKKKNEIADLAQKSTTLTKGVRVSWETKHTDSDIQLAGGGATISKSGTVVGFTLVGTPAGSLDAVLCVAGDDKAFHIVNAGLARILD